MESISTLICYECGKFYDTEDHQPILIDCSHSICLLCVTVTSDCPICSREFLEPHVNDDFLELVKYANSILPKDDSEYSKRVQTIQQSMCTKCSDSEKATRICATCVKEFGFDLKKLETSSKWVIQSFAIPVSSGDFSICSNCAIDNHSDENHEILRVRDIENLEDIIKMEIYVKFHEDEETLEDFYRKIILQYQLWKRGFDLLADENIVGNMEQIPSEQLKKSYEESKKPRRDLISRVRKLKAEELKIHQNHLQMHIQENTYPELNEKLQKIDNSFSEILGQQEEYGEFDYEIAEKMENFESEFKEKQLVVLEVDDDFEKFYKHQALLEELQSLKTAMDSGMQKLAVKMQKFNIYLENMRRNLETCEFEEFKIVIYMDIIEENTLIEKSIIEIIQFHERIVFCHLMHLKYFPVTSESTIEDVVFDRFIKDFKKDIEWDF
ncbi:RING-type domain-containing protein [Caenorhabditis elegans]|uniref:RING-type domain-containing protein n=1 Tax=Caenorhabditis elegans TaxID=6239 RepID=V6CLI8_CAEEL|nr:RING-type domain-containing protein [Caenorhabditis elegans]CDK13431.1 RING-type domain-containing protein [Caenorhabditis elegans]|eukprot:NP_001293202.1 Uncharacterized protein CELE_ZK993.5 [Caenorhabditis elegans]